MAATTTNAKRKNVATIAFPDKVDENRARAEWPYDMALIYLDACLVDDTYQRPPLRAFIAAITEQFDETLVGAIFVNERKNGRLAILDGQQRYLAMQAKGKTSCYACVYRAMSLQDEAGFFYRMNKDRKSMQSYYGLRARIVAGDPIATEINSIVESRGFVVGPTSNENEVIGAVRALEIAYGLSSEFRDDSLGPALGTIRNSIFGRKGSLDAWIIQGLARFWSLTEEETVNEKILNDLLADYGPAGLLGMVRERQPQQRGKTQPQIMAAILAQRYNQLIRGAGDKKLVMARYS